MKKLVLAEKPSVGRDIARVLKCNIKRDGYMEGKDYIVSWALGHLVTLSDPEVYDKKYKEWKMEDIPILPEKFRLVIIKKTAKQYNVIKELLARNDVNEIVVATDAGREGELVARWIIEKANIRKKLTRLWISSVTDKAISDGFRNLKDGNLYNKLYESACARAEADWVVGINASRALTCKYNTQLSCGRVQTPTLYMIMRREEEIKKFIPQKYYTIAAKINNTEFKWVGKSDNRIFELDKCDKIISSLKNLNAEVMDIVKKHKSINAPKLYDLTELQRDANKLYDFSAKETLSIMQGLYERHKVLTYPRTDSRYISNDIVDTLKDRINACRNSANNAVISKILKDRIKVSSNFVDNKKVSDHHAIIPTEVAVDGSKISSKERKIYDLVVKRFLAVLMPACTYEQQVITIKIGKETFVNTSDVIMEKGWKSIYSNEDFEDFGEAKMTIRENSYNFRKGEKLKVGSIDKTEGKTKPPAMFNEASLLSAMENPVKYMDDCNDELKKVIGETGGIGTVATRADIIDKLFNNFLIEKRNKDLFITQRGKQLLKFVPEDLKSPILTAKWEKRLKEIEKGNEKRAVFITQMKDFTKQLTDEIKKSDDKFVHDNMTGTKCPECNKFMLEVKGKKGKLYICQDRECGYRKNISLSTEIRCPQCKKKLELCGEGDGRIYVCKCGFREKKKAFDQKRKSEGGKVSKREVEQYMRSQNKENKKSIDEDNPFYKLLGNYKLDKNK